jgi:hypothetical protein
MGQQSHEKYQLISKKQNELMIALQDEIAEKLKVKSEERNIKIEDISSLRYEVYKSTLDAEENIKRTISRVASQLHPFIIERETSEKWSAMEREIEEELTFKYAEPLRETVSEYNKIEW